MTVHPEFSDRLSRSDFDLDAPEFSLLRLRQELEGRLSWLEAQLPSESEPSSRLRPGQKLVDQGLLDQAALDAIQEVIDSADPTAHGERVAPSTAAYVIDTGLKLVEALDMSIETVSIKLEALSPKAKLTYRLLELPARVRRQIAREMGMVSEDELSLPRIEFARLVLRRASDKHELAQLWDEVVAAAQLPEAANPFREL